MARLTNRQLDLMETKINEAINKRFKQVFPKPATTRPQFTDDELIEMFTMGNLVEKTAKDLRAYGSSHVGYTVGAALKVTHYLPTHPKVAEWEAENEARNAYRATLDAAGKHLKEKLVMDGSAALIELDAFTSAIKQLPVPAVEVRAPFKRKVTKKSSTR